jgi:leucyl-tRNA synthetase
MPGYNPSAIEKKWQQRWAEGRVFATDTRDYAKPKFYVLDMFPYPSGQGLHVGHPEGYTATDILARYKRARGFNVMHPMGWDAFGLPAEQYAIKNNVHPRETTANNVGRFRKQLQSLGFSYDWEREVDTTDPGYYRWTQWIFLKLYDTWFDEEQQRGRPISELVEEFESARQIANYPLPNADWKKLSATERRQVLAGYRLAYEAEVAVNWCEGLGTVLANEEVIDGKSEVGGFPVERRPMRQWMLRITAYSERLIAGLEKLEWTESLKEMQRNWIGKSEGAEVVFSLASDRLMTKEELDAAGNIILEQAGHALPSGWSTTMPKSAERITVFTTRPDTLFGATYMVLAPEHPLVQKITIADHAAKIEAYRKWAASRSDRERQEDTRKTGEFTGAYAINPVNGKQIPIWVSDYVLMGYGTGAIMAVPAHDERDWEFATKFKLPIVQVVGKNGEAIDLQKEPFCEEGIAVNSPWIDGLPTQEAKSKIISLLEEKGVGKRQVNYKIRDWLFSRQRYWGEPFPIVHLEDGTSVRLADDQLPVRLPELEDFKPTGTIEPPLSKAKEWVNVWVVVEGDVARVVPEGTAGGVKGRRELNTMPQWAGSCWYYLRYLDPRNEQRFVDPAVEKYWLHNGVDLYVGGVEHAVLHLLYARFWHKVLFDWGLVTCEEPFQKLVNQGLILGEMEYTTFRTDSGGQLVSVEFVDGAEGAEPVVRAGKDVPGELTRGQKLLPEKRPAEDVEKRGEHFVLKAQPEIRVDARSFKMSKSRGNVVNPDDVVAEYGADSLRMFEMFMGPLEQVKPWSTAGVEGVYRFLQRVWRNMINPEESDPNKANKLLERHPEGRSDTWWTSSGDLPKEKHAQAEADYQAILRPLHRMIKRVTEDIERLSFNTAIAAMMEFNNTLTKMTYVTLEVAEAFLRVIEPFAPHFADEVLSTIRPDLYEQGLRSIAQRPWPAVDPAMLVDATVEIPVQVNGKLRSRIQVASDVDEATAIAAALADIEVQKFLAGKEPKKKIYVKGRMVNLVV